MHEMSIAEGIIEVVERTAKANNVNRIKSVRVSIGELAGVDIPSLQFAWSSVTQNGPAQGATLTIEQPEGTAWCMNCSKTVPLHKYGDACPHCGGYVLTATGGTDMRVVDFVPIDD
ncbi:MAG: hydrogenase maturation nickel metallochaperone HypA [Sutterella sp.]|nr:hydrogenase maturation nickel metallochaperone HypA [Sutterella sp.]